MFRELEDQDVRDRKDLTNLGCIECQKRGDVRKRL